MSFSRTELESIDTIYGLFYGDFKISKLSDICVEKTGVQTGPFGSQLHNKDYVLNGTPIVTVEHLGENHLIHENLPRVCDMDKERLIKYTLKEGDIVFSRVGSVDRRAYIKKSEDGWLFSGRCLRVRPNQQIIDGKFMSYFFGLSVFKQHIRNIAVGATMPSINTKILSEIHIVYPHLNEQKAIAHILSTLDEKIEVNNQINKTLEKMAQTIFKQWFVEFEFPNEEGEPYQSSGGEMVESELGLIPKGWEVVEMSSLFSVKDGTHDSPKTKDKGHFLITSKHLKENRIDYSSANLISEEDYVNVNKRSKVDRFDILITMIGTVGNIYLVQDEDINFAIKNIGLFKTSENIKLYEYIYMYLKSKALEQYIDKRLAGSTQKYISLTELRKIPVIIPTKDRLSDYKKICKSVYESIYNNSKEIRELEVARDTLLPKLMSGEICVPHKEVNYMSVQKQI